MGESSADVGRFPLPFYVIEHPQGVVLFDCGLHEDLASHDDPTRTVLNAQGMSVEITRSETTSAKLEALEIDPGDVRFAILSHLHFDHVGGLHQLPNAEVVVQDREWLAGFDPDVAAQNFLLRPYFDLGHKVRRIDGVYDLFGDGLLTCLPTFGHTPGHQSLRVRAETGDHILTADACYFCRTIESRQFPAFANAQAMDRSLDGLIALRQPDTTMIFGHDPDQWGDRAVLATSRS